MAWIKGNRYLSESEMQNNALIIGAYLVSREWSINAIAGLLGNMQVESTINPALWQSLNANNMSGGYGLVQWTPATNITDWCDSNGYGWDDGNAQLKWIDEETVSAGQWIKTPSYNISFATFKKSAESPEYLASAFLKNFERASVEKEETRRTNARTWYTFLINTYTFTPRLDSEGIEGSFYYYDENPFYQSGYGLPNCTCYAWGRFWEISDPDGTGVNKPSLPLGDGGSWYDSVDGYSKGSEPKLGAVICWSDDSGGAGHVAIVEKIDSNGDILTSNSAYGSTFFYTKTILKEDGYNTTGKTFQGFIYNPHVYSATTPVNPPIGGLTKRKRGYNFLLFQRRERAKRWIRTNF